MHKFQASILAIAIATTGASVAACGSDAAANGDEASSPPATAQGGVAISASLDICGTVDAYVAASASIDGALTLDGRPLAIAAGARVEGEALLVAHASVCLRARLDLRGVITDCIVIGVGASAGTSSGGGSSGSSGGSSGSSGGSSGSSGGCGGGCTGSSGGGSSGGTGSGGADIDLSATLDICGALQAFTSAAAGAGVGTCTVAGNTLSIASGTQLVGEALVLVGANVCLHATIDVTGNVSAPSTASLALLGSAKVHVCGHVRGYAAASANVAGHVGIGGPDFRIAAGAQLTGAALLVANASVCIDASLDASGALAVGTVSAH